MLPLLLAGCLGLGDTVSEEPYTEWSYEEDTAGGGARMDAAALTAALDGVLALLPSLDPGLPSRTYVEALDQLPEDCPKRDLFNGLNYVEADCEGADGGAFYGYQLWTQFQDQDLLCPEDPQSLCWTRDYRWMTGVSHLETPAGVVVESMGDASFRDFDEQDGTPHVETWLWGDFRTIGGAEDWLAEGLGLQLYVDAWDGAAGRTLRWDGGVSRLHGPVNALWMEAVTLSDEGGACALEPTGAVHLYDTGATWYDLAADGSCDGCLEATVEGELVGGICGDWATLLEWQESPWG